VFSARVATGERFHFSKDIANEKARGKQPLVIPPALLNFLAFQNEFIEPHVAHVAGIDTPGIIVLGAAVTGGQQSLVAFLTDGTHRAIAALRAGREFKAYCLGARLRLFPVLYAVKCANEAETLNAPRDCGAERPSGLLL